MPKPDVEDLLEQEAFVRSLARSLMAGEADDIVQQTYLQALSRGAEAVDRPQPWLARVVRNIVSNRRRTDARRSDRERSVAKSELVPSSDELMEREQRRSILVHAVDGLPEHLRTVVLLRFFEGQPPRVIAVELDLPVLVVKERLRSALERLRKELGEEHGELSAWLMPLATLLPKPAAVIPARPAKVMAAPSTLGLLVMTSKAKLFVVVGVLLIAALGYMGSQLVAYEGEAEPSEVQALAVEPLVGKVESEHAAEVDSKPTRRETVPVRVAEKENGSLSVRVLYGEDMTPAADLTLVVMRPDADDWDTVQRVKTDAEGRAEFKSLPVGAIRLRSPRNGKHQLVDIRAGEESEVELVLPPGLTISGIVVDVDGIPVSSARLFFACATLSMFELATTGSDGRFTLRACYTEGVLGARADGYAPSSAHLLIGKKNSTKVIRLVLPGAGGGLEGFVTGSEGQPLSGARVSIGGGLTQTIDARENGPARPALLRTDADGGFHVSDLRPGKHPVVIRAEGFGPWVGTCLVTAGSTASVRAILVDGVTLRGYVRDELGEAVGGARISAGEPYTLQYVTTRSKPDGSFRLLDLPAGKVEVGAGHRILGKTSAQLNGVAGATIDQVVIFRRGIELRGSVVDAAGDPVAASVSAFAKSTGNEPSWLSTAQTDSAGRFVVFSCPEGRLLSLSVNGATINTITRKGVNPRDGVVEFLGQRAAEPNESTLIVGKVVTPDGKAISNATISLRGKQEPESSPLTSAFLLTGANGGFQIRAIPGKYRIESRADGFPALNSAWRELTLDTTLDFGELRMVRGGCVRVEVGPGEAKMPKAFYIRDLDGRIRGAIGGRVRPFRSSQLAPGTYQVYPKDGAFEEDAVEFVVRAGVETRVSIGLRPK